MKRVVSFFILSIAISFACGKKAPKPIYEQGTKEYEFFKPLSKRLTSLNPDKTIKLISTKEFNVYNNDILPNIYAVWSRYPERLKSISDSRLNTFVHQMAAQEAEKNLLIAAAKLNNITVPEDSVQVVMQKLYDRQGSKEAFIRKIEQQGRSLEEVKQNIREAQVVKKFLDNIIYTDITVNEGEIGFAYDQDKYATVRHILLRTEGKSEAEKDKVYKKMRGILERAQAGEDFAELAKQYSEDPKTRDTGGLIENFQHGQMVKPFEDAAFELPVGSISNIIETEYGFHIIKIIERKKEERPYHVVKEEIRQYLIDAKKRQEYQSLVDGLKNKYEYKELF